MQLFLKPYGFTVKVGTQKKNRVRTKNKALFQQFIMKILQDIDTRIHAVCSSGFAVSEPSALSTRCGPSGGHRWTEPPNAFAPRFYSFQLGDDVTVGGILDSINRTRG